MKTAYLGILLVLLAVTVTLFSRGLRELGQLTNIDGIPYPVDGEDVVITEKLAHADVYLKESRFAKQLRISITFIPLQTAQLEIGVRENSFWLSYPRHLLYRRADELPALDPSKPITRTVVIPLTDKLPDHDRSADLMFFANNPAAPASGPIDTTLWHVRSISANVEPAWPTVDAVKDYLRGLFRPEQII